MTFITILAAIALIALLLNTPLNSKTVTPLDRFRGWYANYPKYRVLKERCSLATEQWYGHAYRYKVEARTAFWPFWCKEHSSFKLEDAQAYIKGQKEETARSREKPVVIANE